MPWTTGPSPACSVCTWVWVTLNGAVTFTRGAVVSVDPATAMLPVVPANVQSGVPLFCGAAVGHEPAAVAVPDAASGRTNAATQAASAPEKYTREDLTAATLQPLIASLMVALRWVTGLAAQSPAGGVARLAWPAAEIGPRHRCPARIESLHLMHSVAARRRTHVAACRRTRLNADAPDSGQAASN